MPRPKWKRNTYRADRIANDECLSYNPVGKKLAFEGTDRRLRKDGILIWRVPAEVQMLSLIITGHTPGDKKWFLTFLVV